MTSMYANDHGLPASSLNKGVQIQSFKELPSLAQEKISVKLKRHQAAQHTGSSTDNNRLC